MNLKKVLIPILLISALMVSACVYIVLPEGLEELEDTQGNGNGWAGIVTHIGESGAGGVHIDITIRNDTGNWSTLRAVDNQPAILTAGDGSTINCATVVVGTGGHRFAPGFQMRGYTTAENGALDPQTLYVECDQSVDTAGAQLTIDYISFQGELDYYVEVEEANKVEGTLELNLDEIVPDLEYPIATPIEGLVQASDVEILALSENVISLLEVQRHASGLQFTWKNQNPSKFPLKTHIGIPPVIGSDGILYGNYVTIDMPEIPLTPAQSSIEWTTEVPLPEDAGGLYILLSVESKKPRTYLNYVLDITGY